LRHKQDIGEFQTGVKAALFKASICSGLYRVSLYLLGNSLSTGFALALDFLVFETNFADDIAPAFRPYNNAWSSQSIRAPIQVRVEHIDGVASNLVPDQKMTSQSNWWS